MVMRYLPGEAPGHQGMIPTKRRRDRTATSHAGADEAADEAADAAADEDEDQTATTLPLSSSGSRSHKKTREGDRVLTWIWKVGRVDARDLPSSSKKMSEEEMYKCTFPYQYVLAEH